MKTVSIIIPAKNEEQYIRLCLESLAALDFAKDRYEIILADNGSTDRTVEIALSAGVKIVNLPDKTTISAVRNGGAAMASGDILVFLDADCTVARDWLQQAERYFSRQDIACFGSSPVIPDQATWVEKTWFLARKSHQEVFERQWQESTNMFVPKRFFDQVKGFNEQLVTCEDVDLSYRLLKLGKIIADSRIVAIHHRDPKTISEFFAKEKWRGKSNYSGLFQHGIKMSELPSLILPIFVTGMLLLAIIWCLFGVFLKAFVCIVLALLPVMGISWLKLRNNFTPRVFLCLVFLYTVYFVARASALLPKF
jgi:glycosyltransferase involved in cell wall biosynthesis